MRRLTLAIALLIPAAPLWAGQKAVTLKTADGCSLAAFYSAPSSGSYVFINTHGLGSTKEEWGNFQEALAEGGFGWLSLDLRGHGGSLLCGGKKVSYRSFTTADWNAASKDIEAAAAWLAKKKIPASRMVFCGASIGANLSLKAAAEGRLIPGGVALLSPGLDYAGVSSAPKLASGRKFRLFIAASENDPYAWRSAAALSLAASKYGLAARFVMGAGGHGAEMFRDPALAKALGAWALEK